MGWNRLWDCFTTWRLVCAEQRCDLGKHWNSSQLRRNWSVLDLWPHHRKEGRITRGFLQLDHSPYSRCRTSLPSSVSSIIDPLKICYNYFILFYLDKEHSYTLMHMFKHIVIYIHIHMLILKPSHEETCAWNCASEKNRLFELENRAGLSVTFIPPSVSSSVLQPGADAGKDLSQRSVWTCFWPHPGALQHRQPPAAVSAAAARVQTEGEGKHPINAQIWLNTAFSVTHLSYHVVGIVIFIVQHTSLRFIRMFDR